MSPSPSSTASCPGRTGCRICPASTSSSYHVPASRQTEIGGDFYAALRTGEGVLTAGGDVVGHSLDAATVMVEIRHALRACCVTESDPVVLAERLDRMLQRVPPDVTATVCLALADPGSGWVRIANAGHIPPLILRDGAAPTTPTRAVRRSGWANGPRRPSGTWPPPTAS